MKNLPKIKECLEYIYEIMVEYNPEGWAESVLYWKNNILKKPEEIIRNINRCGGGWGSLSDFVVQKDGKIVYEKDVDYSNLKSLMLKLVGDEYDILMGSEKYQSLYPDSPLPPKKDYPKLIIDALDALQVLFSGKQALDLFLMLSSLKEGLTNRLEETLREIVQDHNNIIFDEDMPKKLSFSEEKRMLFYIRRSDFFGLCHEYYAKLMAIKRYPTLFSEDDL